MQLCHQNRFSHALLLLGDDRVEKDRLAMELATKLLGERTQHYLRFLNCNLENASEIKVDQIRDLIETPGQPSWIIPRAELLNKQASNALLKTLEEPRGDQFFILIAPSTRSLLPTLVSRCQRIYVPAKNVSAPINNAPKIPENKLARLELIETLVKSKADLKSLFEQWSYGASLDLKERLFRAFGDLERHVNSQLILEQLLL